MERPVRGGRAATTIVAAAMTGATILAATFVIAAPRWSVAIADRLVVEVMTARTVVAVTCVAAVGIGSFLLVHRYLRFTEATRRGWEELAAASAHGVLLVEFGDPPRVLFVNRGLEDITGHPPEAFLADPYLPLRVVGAADRPRLEAIFLDPGRKDWPQRFTVLRPDGSRRDVELSGSLVHPDSRRPLFQALVTDVTEREERERALGAVAEAERAAAQRLRDIVSLRDSFVTSISHELRTPLTVITGAADTLRRYPTALCPSTRSELERAIVEQSTRLSALLDDVVNIGGAGQPSGYRVPQQIIEVGHLVVDAVAASDIADRVRLDIPGPVLARCDEPRLRRMVHELLANAQKYAPDSLVHLSLSNGGGQWTLRVHDAGPGLDAGDLAQVPEPFYRADSDHPRPGLGLGLTFVAEVAAQHGGSLRLHNDAGLEVTVTGACDPAARTARGEVVIHLDEVPGASATQPAATPPG